MAKVVVTGGSGALGQYVIREFLGHGHDVLSLDKNPPQIRLCPSWVVDLTRSGDLYQALKGADAVIHLGAYPAPNLAPDTETFCNNVTASYNVIKTAADLGVGTIVAASSGAAFGFIYAPRLLLPDYLPLDEAHPCRPQDSYGLSKVVGEKIADSFVAAHEMKIGSLRFPGINFDLSYKSFAERWEGPTRRLGRLWSYIDVRDAATACRLTMEAKFTGHEVFVVAAPTSAMTQSTDDLVREHFPDVRKAKPELKGNWSAMDSTKARRMLGFKAEHVWEKYKL
jgi:nucleoside-diphosphate-sugar epimerase